MSSKSWRENAYVKVVLQDLVKGDLTIKAIVQDIHTRVDSILELENANSEAHALMQALSHKLEELERIAEEQNRESDKKDLITEKDNHMAELSSSRIALRKANLLAQKRLSANARNALMQGQSSELRKRGTRDKESLAKMSAGITDNLLSVSQMLAKEVALSEETVQTLTQSSNTVLETQEEFKMMGGVIQQSTKLLSKYDRRELTDKALIFLALSFFFACVIYVIKKRIF